ncbi:CC_3452 family protein [Sphingomicrobium clamense]|uniref:Uncharacterized protein n=1 Tax=Sphingomicrobium clamense TaxID=2851013 RepID=A0ABS6V3I9_9SPHN|nr:hypothetical protein [Sphingomicrobium sp. B8]MBW0144120.1 hypothetical protein [Sphingomicrobium sp. B8]
MRAILAPLALAFVATPAIAAAPALNATLEAPSEGRVITRGGAWNCDGNGCTLRSAESRPMIQCQLLAKEAGALASFAVDGRAFDADDLAKCNKKAR